MSLPHPLPVIPVLDLAGGVVVRALRGERAAYRPIVSSLVAGSDAVAVAAALLACVSSTEPALYVADLDALQGGVLQVAALSRLLDARPDLTLWLDGGFRDLAAADAARAALGVDAGRLRPVYGTEAIVDGAALEAIAADPRAVLSLDSRRARPLDPAGCWERPQAWPRTLIVMTLDRVGAAVGPDLEAFARLRSRAPDRHWIGAGGVRDAADLAAGAAAGASAWLVASALHDGTLR